MTAIESKVIEAWRRAADDLGIRFSSPFTVMTHHARRVDCIGFIHHFGRRVGTIISVLDQPSSLANFIGQWPDKDHYISVLGPGYAKYDRQLFIDTLDDWQFFGPDSERPVWYTGKYWGQENQSRGEPIRGEG
jgi:hypothetical protein